MRNFCFSTKAAVVAGMLSLTVMTLPAAQTQSSRQHSPASQKPDQSTQSTDQAELTKRIRVAENVRSSGDLPAIALANRRLIASALRAMGRLRLLESASSQSAELYRASLQFEDIPEAHADLARSSLMAGQDEDAILEAQKALSADPGNVGAYVTLGRALSDKQEFAKAADALSHAERIQPSIETLYSLAICWLSLNNAQGRQNADAVFARMKEMAGDSGSLHVLMGRAYRDAGLMPDAVKQFKRAIELDTTTPHAHYFLGLAYLSLNEWNWTPEVQAELEKEVQYHPQDFLANYMLGFLASGRREYAASDKYLKTAAALNPTWPEPFLYMGLNAFAQADNKTAETMLRKAVELTGQDEARSNYQIRRAYVDLGRILAREGREQESDAFVAKARDLENKTMVDSQQRTTALLISEGGNAGNMAAVMPLDKQQENQAAPISRSGAAASARVDAAALTNSNLTASQRVIASKEDDILRPTLGQSYSDLATSEAIQHDFTDAVTHYEAAEQWDPDIPDLEKNLGQAAFRADNYPEAIHGLAQAIKKNPNALPLRAMLGMAYFEMQRYGDAATTFYPLGEAGMHDSKVGYAWAASLTKAGDLKDASQVLAIYQTGPLTNDGLLVVGQLWTEIGDFDRATTTLRQILASDPSFPKVHYSIAMADIRAGNWSDARTELNAELANAPDDPDVMFELGIIDMRESKNDDAVKLFEQVIAKHPDYAEAQYQMGKILLDRGQVQSSVPHLEAAARLSPEKSYMHYQLQKAYRGVGRTADADREAAVYQQLETKARAAARDQVNQTLQQKP
jgi:tetratricopeptide (TPR) repeat protein